MTKSENIDRIERERGADIEAVLVAMFDAGMTRAEIGRELGVSALTISNWIALLGGELRMYHRYIPKQSELVER